MSLLELVVLQPSTYTSAMVWSLVALVGVTLIWGTTFVVVKDALQTMPASLLLALRFGIAWLLMLWVRPQRASLWAGLVLGVMAWIGYLAQTVGLVYTSASNAAFITGLSVILTPLFSSLFYRKRLATRVYAAALIALAGLGFMSFGAQIGDSSLTINIGDIWVLGCAVMYAVTILYIEAVMTKHSLRQAITIQLYPMALLSLLWASPHLGMLPHLPWQSYAAVTYLAVVATIVTSLLHLWAQRKVSASLTALIFLLEPVFAAIFAAALLDERLSSWQYVGAALIFAAMVLGEWRGMPRLRRKQGAP